VQGTITSAALAHNLVGDPATRTYYVYLPPGYSTSGKRYPVVYVIQGEQDMGFGPMDWVQGGPASYAPLPTWMDSLLSTGAVKPMILVFPDSTNSFVYPEYFNSLTLGDYDTYISKELVAQIDSTYRTLTSPASRGLMGGVLEGGFGALHLSLRHPDVFGVSASMDPMMDPPNDSLPQAAATSFQGNPENFAVLQTKEADGWPPATYYAQAAAVASDPSKPPFYIDLPFKMLNGKGETDPAVFAKINDAFNLENDVHAYLGQPTRLSGLQIYYDTDPENAEPFGFSIFSQGVYRSTLVDNAYRSFDQFLTQNGVNHDTVACEGEAESMNVSVPLKFMSAHLAFQ